MTVASTGGVAGTTVAAPDGSNHIEYTVMPRPLWSGAISFGLLNIPVQLMPGERKNDLKFHMLDSRDKSRVRYERVNAETGEEVPWKEIVKAFEYSKNNYVVLQEEDFKRAAPESRESVDIEAFVDPAEIPVQFFEQPYYLVPQRRAEKGYVLLRDTLKQLGRAGVARVVVRTREHLALLMAQDQALVLMLLRFPQELIAEDEYKFPDKGKALRIAPKEYEMARQLVESMSGKWTPAKYHDEFRARLRKAIDARSKKGKKRVSAPEPEALAQEGSGKVVDFMALLQESIRKQKRTPAASAPTRRATRAKASAKA